MMEWDRGDDSEHIFKKKRNDNNVMTERERDGARARDEKERRRI